jgi:ethanolamine ammonia-lyase small subunit
MMMTADTIDIEAIVQAVMSELKKQGKNGNGAEPAAAVKSGTNGNGLVIDLDDPTRPEARTAIGVKNPRDLEGLRNLRAATTARIAVGRAGPRPRTSTLLLFQADHGVTQDSIYGQVTEDVINKFNLFTVTTQAKDRGEYLLRPDLGRKLSEEGRKTVAERCVKHPQVQIVVGDGLSAAAINNNLAAIYPVIEQGLKSGGISIGTPFFVENARVGLMNDINEIIGADVVIVLIGERPGLGVADAMSVYMGYKPGPGKTDAQRDVICMITTAGGTNPLEAGAFVVEMIKKMLKYQASGIELKQKLSSEG